MAEELLSLKWNNHQAHFVDILTFLREQEIFIDATLACGGKLYPAHKFVLSTCSDYFKQMFTKSPNKHPIVFMKDVSCRDLEALLDFMYNGEVNVPQSSLGSLIKTAEGLQIKGLAVPDDPPFSKKEHSSVLKDRRDRDQKARRDKSFSPPPKRFRERDRSPIVNSTPSSFQNHSHSRPKSPHNSSNNQISVNIGLSKHEDNLDEDSRTSAQSGASEHSINVNSKSNISSQSQLNNDETDQFVNSNQPIASEPSPGPSGLHRSAQSKEEELDIKQEEDMGLVDLGGDDDDDDWRDGEGMEGNSLDGGGGDTSASSANAQNFSDVLLPLSDGSLPSGDPAMLLGCIASAAAASLPSQDFSSSSVWSLPSIVSSSTSCSLLSRAPIAAGSNSSANCNLPLEQQHHWDSLAGIGSIRGPYRQSRIRSQITVIEAEINSLEALIETSMIGETEREALLGRINTKQIEIMQLKRELDRLINGQMRQRKFRAKLKLSSA